MKSYQMQYDTVIQEEIFDPQSPQILYSYQEKVIFITVFKCAFTFLLEVTNKKLSQSSCLLKIFVLKFLLLLPSLQKSYLRKEKSILKVSWQQMKFPGCFYLVLPLLGMAVPVPQWIFTHSSHVLCQAAGSRQQTVSGFFQLSRQESKNNLLKQVLSEKQR